MRGLFVDEYQDCSLSQHAIVYCTAKVIPTCIMGDDMQAIFDFGDPRPDWNGQVCAHFPIVGRLSTPWRWLNANSEPLGQWLLSARGILEAGGKIDLSQLPTTVSWVPLTGASSDNELIRSAGLITASPTGSVLILGDSRNPSGQRRLCKPNTRSRNC